MSSTKGYSAERELLGQETNDETMLCYTILNSLREILGWERVKFEARIGGNFWLLSVSQYYRMWGGCEDVGREAMLELPG